MAASANPAIICGCFCLIKLTVWLLLAFALRSCKTMARLNYMVVQVARVAGQLQRFQLQRFQACPSVQACQVTHRETEVGYC